MCVCVYVPAPRMLLKDMEMGLCAAAKELLFMWPLTGPEAPPAAAAFDECSDWVVILLCESLCLRGVVMTCCLAALGGCDAMVAL